MKSVKVDEDSCSPEVKARALRLYETYIANSEGKAWDGRPCPPWTMLGQAVRSHWCAVAIEVERELRELRDSLTKEAP